MWKIIYRADRGLGGVRGQREKKESGGEYSEGIICTYKNFNEEI